jgi:hypothetical protein
MQILESKAEKKQLPVQNGSSFFMIVDENLRCIS